VSGVGVHVWVEKQEGCVKLARRCGRDICMKSFMGILSNCAKDTKIWLQYSRCLHVSHDCCSRRSSFRLLLPESTLDLQCKELAHKVLTCEAHAPLFRQW